MIMQIIMVLTTVSSLNVELGPDVQRYVSLQNEPLNARLEPLQQEKHSHSDHAIHEYL